ncbi:MAG: cation:proton antiporter [Leptospiraceae bacterium]|nr:cation:proton antiporter [Leptospiraceae bacterium]MCP5498147.1 cation:proton antiporter [Leptospiraceae bacterium]
MFIVSRYLGLPTIVLLLIGGIILGPEFLNIVKPQSLGKSLHLLISLCVAIILFEGGLTLQPQGFKKAPKMIWKLLTLGVLVTWFGTAFLVYLLLHFSIPMSLLTGSLIIVTGPTVIAPLLKRIKVKEKLYHILHWEGVLIDPIGVFIAILCFEWMSLEGSALTNIVQLSYRLLIGILIGGSGGYIITTLLKIEKIPEEQVNIFVFAFALFLFGISDFIVHEAGILTVVIAGLVIGWANPPKLKHIQTFKSELTELAIALVFMLLAANLKLKNFLHVGWMGLILLGSVLFVIRPLSILLCSYKTSLQLNEKLFLAWIAPRGVVAGSMASLFSVELIRLGHPNAAFLETFTFSVIAATIILQGTTAGYLAKFLKVEELEKKGWLIIGAHLFSRKIAKFLQKTTGGICIFLDTNADSVAETQKEGYLAFQGNALSTEAISPELINSIGNLLALTDNRDLNQLICEKWSELIDKHHLYRWSSQSPEMEKQIGGLGIPIWSTLTKPSQIAYSLKNKEAFIREYNLATLKKQTTTTFLMGKTKGKLNLESKVAGINGTDNVLVLERLSQHLSELFLEKHIFFLEVASYENLILTILEKVKSLHPELPFNRISSELLERERHFPTTLAHGVAAPHLHCPNLENPLCFVAKMDSGIQLQTYEGDAVEIIFLLLSPESAPDLHLRILAEIAKTVSTKEAVNQLKHSKSVDEFLSKLKEKGENR